MGSPHSRDGERTLPWRRRRPTSRQRPLLRSMAELWKLKSMRILLLMAMFGSFNGYAILTWSPAFFIRLHGLTAAELAPRIGVATATGLFLGNIMAGRISDVLGARDLRWYMRVSGFGSILAVPFLFVFLFSNNVYAALAGLGATQLLLTTFMPPLFTISLTLAPVRLRATTSMMMGMALYVVGLSFGPLIIGMLNDWLTPAEGITAVRHSLLIVAATLTLCGLLSLLANRWIVADAQAATATRQMT
ncbi:MFS transporter (plasmid) [Sphingobium sp. SJ10-10]|uniref:MFS transporter n=1 Tax=Sphingobium sp. SJ10-10 TaxID=3114999 RepID=UPI002E19AE8A|nr:MFS transporter [Sphingobium sp. SJ10-10]